MSQTRDRGTGKPIITHAKIDPKKLGIVIVYMGRVHTKEVKDSLLGRQM